MSLIPVTVNIGAAAVYPQTTFIPVATTINAGRNPDGSINSVPVNMLPLQFTYVNNAVWVVSATGQLQGRFDAIRGFYVDNTGANNDVLIVNVTSGFQIRVPARSSGFYPFLCGQGDLTFYLQNTGGTGNDITNVYALDTGPAPANYPEYQRVLTYGVGSTGAFTPIYGSTDINGNPVPQIIANKIVRQPLETHSLINTIPTNGNNNYITTNNWYIESFYCYFLSNGATSSYTPFGLILYDGNTPIYDAYTEVGGGGQMTPAFVDLSNIKYKSLGTGQLYVCSYNPNNSLYCGFNMSVSY